MFIVSLNNSLAVIDEHFNILTDFIPNCKTIKGLDDYTNGIYGYVNVETGNLYVKFNNTKIKICDLEEESKRLQNLKMIYLC